MDVNSILNKYGKRLESEVDPGTYQSIDGEDSKEFDQFKEETLPKFSRYERWCKNLGSIVKIKLGEKDNIRISEFLQIAHLNVTASEVVGLALLAGFGTFMLGFLIAALAYYYFEEILIGFLFLTVLSSGFLFYYFYSMPARLANQWRLMASNQMIPCILYVVVYMKHTSNLERAVQFASEHLEPPLNFDLKKVFWDLETGKFSSIKNSLDNYLESWRGYCPEFVESFNLIESSLYEPSEDRRVEVLERSLKVILDGVYDKMLKFSHSVKAPLTNIYMLGIVLPTLALALLPLASTLIGGAIKWYHVMILFDLLVPFLVFYMTDDILIKRPGGYGETSNLELNPLYYKYKSKLPYAFASIVAVPLIFLGLLPFILRIPGFAEMIGLKEDYFFSEIGLGFFGDLKIFDFIEVKDGFVGPMGLVALLLSLLIPLAIFLFFNIAYGQRTKELIKSRDYTRDLEKEFNNSLFKLGNRIGDGVPAELAFGRVAESSKGLVTEDFFRIVNANINGLGMDLKNAIFNPKTGAIIYYPSQLISTSMHILIESVRKGLKVAAQALMSISEYVRNVNKISERLRDLLADVVSDMRSNMTFLAPLLAGIVVGLSSMITLILSKLSTLMNSPESNIGVAGGFANLTELFAVEGLIPPYFLQIVIGIYIAEIVFILTKALVTVDAGNDKLKETYEISRNIMQGGMLYFIVSLVSILLLTGLAVIALGNL